MTITKRELWVLRQMHLNPTPHTDFSAIDRDALKRLWMRGYICLLTNDTWDLSTKGRLLLDCGGAIH